MRLQVLLLPFYDLYKNAICGFISQGKTLRILERVSLLFEQYLRGGGVVLQSRKFVFSLFLPLKFTFLGFFNSYFYLLSLISASLLIYISAILLSLFENNWKNFMFHQYFILHQTKHENLRSSILVSSFTIFSKNSKYQGGPYFLKLGWTIFSKTRLDLII